MIKAYELRNAGHFDEAIAAYRNEIAANPGNIDLVYGLSQAYLGAGDYAEAIPLLWQVHHDEKAKIKDHPGQQLNIACAYWCTENRNQAIELARGLCEGILDRSIGMAPDLAGGATYGLILHYMTTTARDASNFEYALKYLKKLKVKYDKNPDRIQAPRQSVRQLLGNTSFKEVLREATYSVVEKRPGVDDLSKAKKLAQKNISTKSALRVALFHDGVYRRTLGDEVGCMSRMKEVTDLGISGSLTRYYLARHEINRANSSSAC